MDRDSGAIERACTEAARSLGYQDLRKHQMLVVSSFLKRNDVFGVLPTGYGKSLCYAILPLVFDRLQGTNNSVVIVITPLTAIIKDQVSYKMFFSMYRALFSVC